MRISASEANELLSRIDSHTADFSGHYTDNYRVHTSAGDALLRRSRGDVHQGYDPRMMPEVDALKAAYTTTALVPEVLYSSEKFLIEQFIVGSRPALESSDVLAWVPDLLAQVRKMQSRNISRPSLRTVYDWQVWFQRFLSNLYATLPPVHASRIAELQLPPIEQVWNPDHAQSERALTLVHSDLHPANLLVNDQGVWILDWELAIAADPIWEAAVALHRTPWPTADIEAQVTGLWLELYDIDSASDLLRQYRTIETWKSLIVDSARFPEHITADPSCLDSQAQRFHELVTAGTKSCGCAVLSLGEVRDLLARWAKQAD
ncbi:aminoglycoside phosphotransferase family protein [Nocardia vinacea]|uniref:aminoglycoside phosphotransferase family protein n=1 Tax=Nocardia vinacea TaxID=96468 RepID=UPI0002F7EC81|nr:aminoglycoside phosphotransferase family protein [Nocardia vinacea]